MLETLGKVAAESLIREVTKAIGKALEGVAKKIEVLDHDDATMDQLVYKDRNIAHLGICRCTVGDVVNVTGAKIHRFDASESVIKRLYARGAKINLLDASNSKIEHLNISGATLNIFDITLVQINFYC